MNRVILAFAAIILMTTLSNARDLRLQPNPYTVKSDKQTNDVKKGTFILKGTVKGFSSNVPLKNVLIGCLSSGIWVRTDEQGAFEITLKSTDSTVYFYKEGWSELVMEDYEFKDQHSIILDVWLSQPQKNDVKRKPVIYLYADKDLSATVQIDPKGSFTFCYPEYTNGWNVDVQKNGGLKVAGNSYPYLFWEAESEGMTYTTEDGKLPGYLIESTEVISFFEEKLSSLGLNEQEQADFITYWGPLLSHKKYAFIQFVVDDAYEADIASLKITPEPDQMKRVFILCSGTDSDNLGMEIIPQELTSFERNGFTVVEWGGTILDIENLTP